MEIIGVTRMHDGKEVDECVLKCSTHEYYYKGLPPLISGCADCWLTYFYGNVARAGGDIRPKVEQLEEAIRHAAELAEKGKWDFEPDFKVEFSQED